jgi:hypothetical protein
VKAREREAARAAAARARAAVEAARRAEDERNAEQSNLRLIAGARGALSSAQQLGDAMRGSAERTAAARAAQAQAQVAAMNDEDEAIVLLLLAA